MILRLFLLICALAVLPDRSHADTPSPERLAAAKRMMQATGAVRQFDDLMPLIISQLGQSYISLAPDKAKEIREAFTAVSAKLVAKKGSLVDQIAALYAAQLELAEIQSVIAFYESPAGAKFVSIQPTVMQQSMMLSQRWAVEIGREIEEETRTELQKRGINPASR